MNNQDKSISKSYLEQNDTLKNLFDSSLIDFESLFENEDTVVFNANDLLKVMHIFQILERKLIEIFQIFSYPFCSMIERPNTPKTRHR